MWIVWTEGGGGQGSGGGGVGVEEVARQRGEGCGYVDREEKSRVSGIGTRGHQEHSPWSPSHYFDACVCTSSSHASCF